MGENTPSPESGAAWTPDVRSILENIPGGILVCAVADGLLTPVFCSGGVAALSGHTQEEYLTLLGGDALRAVCDEDRPKVKAAIFSAVQSGRPVETKLHQRIAGEAADGIYVIGKKDYSLLYVNERINLFVDSGVPVVGRKCYVALHGRREPCEFCPLDGEDDKNREMLIPADKIYATAIRETDWDGIPAYVMYLTDITVKAHVDRERERLERYYQTLIRHLPGGIMVLRRDADGALVPGFISDGFAAMTGMKLEQVYALYGHDAGASVHPDDAGYALSRIRRQMDTGLDSCETVYRLRKGEHDYIWVKNRSALILDEDRPPRIYAMFSDVSDEVTERADLSRRYNDMLMQHHRGVARGEIITGHCNITGNVIIEITDQTNSRLLETFGHAHELFSRAWPVWSWMRTSTAPFWSVFSRRRCARPLSGASSGMIWSASSNCRLRRRDAMSGSSSSWWSHRTAATSSACSLFWT